MKGVKEMKQIFSRGGGCYYTQLLWKGGSCHLEVSSMRESGVNAH